MLVYLLAHNQYSLSVSFDLECTCQNFSPGLVCLFIRAFASILYLSLSFAALPWRFCSPSNGTSTIESYLNLLHFQMIHSSGMLIQLFMNILWSYVYE